MSTRMADYRDAVEHLPEGAALVIRDSSWEEYERALEELSDSPNLRVTYDEGTLEIMAPLSEHEKAARFIDDLVRAYADARQLAVEKIGSTTWKRKALGRGTEPDTCYYVTNVMRVIGKAMIDLESDPPPDIVVEVDITNESLNKFSIYAALGVPEIWRYDGRTAVFHELRSGRYETIAQSRALVGLTPALLVDALDDSRNRGQTAALDVFRQRIRDAT